jgi:hypothetical protein
MGRTRGSQKALLILPFLVLFGSMTVLYGAGLPAKITSPKDKAKVSGTVQVKAQLTTSGPIAYVLLVVDGTRPISMNSAPWTFELDTRELANGPHEVSVEAYDSHSLIAASKAITIYTNNDAPEPEVVVAKQPPTPAKATAAAPAPKMHAAKPAAKTQTARTPKAVAPAAKVQTAVPAPKAQAVAPAAEVPTSTAAPGVTLEPRAIETAEAIATGASAAPIMTMRGPGPEPTRTAALETPAARGTELVKAETSAASVAAPSPATPPAVKVAQSSLPHSTPMVMIDGQSLDADVASMLVHGRMHSGFRALFAATGARVDWIPSERTALCVAGSLTVEVPVGSRVARVNGREVDMGGIATIKDGRTMVPLRFFAQVTGSSIHWNAQTGVASVQTPTHALASVPASISSPASMPAPVTDSSGMRTPTFAVAGRAP